MMNAGQMSYTGHLLLSSFLFYFSSGRVPVLEKASKSVWDLILDENALGKEISETVERVFCRLSGREPPLFPGSTQEEKEQDENPSSASKKRSFNDMNGGVEKVDTGSDDVPPASEDKNPVTDTKT